MERIIKKIIIGGNMKDMPKHLKDILGDELPKTFKKFSDILDNDDEEINSKHEADKMLEEQLKNKETENVDDEQIEDDYDSDEDNYTTKADFKQLLSKLEKIEQLLSTAKEEKTETIKSE